MKKGFWTTDWFAGLVVTLVFLVFQGSAWLQSVERFAYDVGVRASSGTPSERVAVIAIDDESLANIGRWPWSRDILAEMIDRLREGGAKVIGLPILLFEPQIDPGLERITVLADRFREIQSSTRAAGALGGELAEFGQALAAAEQALNTDARLARSMASAGNVVMAMTFVIGEPLGNPDAELPDFVVANALPNFADRVGAAERNQYPLSTITAMYPIPELGGPAAALGHLNAFPDVDGGIRSEPLVLRYYDAYYPSLSLQLAARSLNLGVDDIQVKLGEGVRLGRLNIGTDPLLQMYTFFYADDGAVPAFPVDSFFDVKSGKIPVDKYRDKVVLIGPTAVGLGAPQVTPISPAMPPVVTLAHSVSSILNEDFFVIPEWAGWAQWGILLLVALFLIFLLPRLKAGPAAGLTVAVFVLLLGANVGLMASEGIWLQLMVPATLLLAGYLLLTTKRYLVTERGKAASDAESAESNRMLGLAYQGKGDLDMAFASFRKVPVGPAVLDLLYNLALDFERKRQFNKAGSVYRYMAEHDPKFRDIESRMNRSKAMEETVMLGGAGATTAGGTMLLDGGGVEKPMLGRYEVEKELGKGAMGVVYLGKDPKINRVVAIKTMALAQEFEADELEEVKERFFREAETAGRLSHPNIVTIFDAGEEHDLAYIAMEFLKGKDLAPFTKAENLLEVPKVVDIVALSADALDYAHAQNVVHRDIKPANIMYEVDTGKVTLTDFGIARITDSSKTKTGMVLGTPSYMSPEQLSGKKVDGRSDLFSLGVMLYQLLTGGLPFTGDSMATLMFKIANEPHPDLLAARADLPASLKSIVDKALSKDVEQRYQRGAQMAKDLRAYATAG